MTNLLAPVAKAKFFDNNGRPANGYKLFTYEAGTSTKADTFPSADSVVPNDNPIILDFRGEANVWIPPNVAYKFVFSPPNDTDPPTAPIWSVDDIESAQLVTLYGGVDTGIANAYVLDSASGVNSYFDGLVLYWTPSNDNSGVATINVNGLGPVPLRMPDGSSPIAGMIPANGYVQIIYRSGVFYVMFSTAVLPEFGSFTVTVASGLTTNPSGTAIWCKSGLNVTLILPALSGTGSGTTMTLSGIPAAISGTLAANQPVPIQLIDNGVSEMGLITVTPLSTWSVTRLTGAFTPGARGVGGGVISFMTANP